MVLVDLCLIGWLAAAGPTVDPPPSPRAAGKPEALPQAEHDEARARAAWEEGAKAFGEGRLRDAIQKFEETYRYSGRPGPMFSLGQAHRHLWEQEHDHVHRELAIRRYQQYIDDDPEGRRVLEAERWIAELSKFEELEDLGDSAKLFTRLSLSSSIGDAIASIDGGVPVKVPETIDVAPGRHEVVMSAPGFHPLRRAVDVPEGSLVPLELALTPMEAMLTVKGPAGAVLYVDGERVARLPTKGPVALAPGFRQIGVAQRGRSLYVRNLELGRGESHEVTAELERTGQRKVAYAAIGIGTTASVASLALMGVAFDQQRRANAIETERTDSSIDISEQTEKQRHIDRRDTLRTAAIATGVTGLVVLAAGIILYFTDRPPIASQLHRPDAGAPRARKAVGFRLTGAGLGAVF